MSSKGLKPLVYDVIEAWKISRFGLPLGDNDSP